MIKFTNKGKFIYRLIILVCLLYAPPNHADLTFGALPSFNIDINTTISFSGNLTCPGLIFKPGDGSADIILPIPTTFPNFSVIHTYVNAGVFTAEFAETGTCSTGTREQRVFTFNVTDPNPPQGQPPTTIPVTTPSTSAPTVSNALRIQAIDITFQNYQKHITVDKNDDDIKALAQIKYTGSGLVDGFWEVDGHALSPIKKHLYSGGSTRLRTPDFPLLPTFREGIHMIRLIITSPTPFISPSIAYIVRATEKIKLINPSNHSQLSRDELFFKWSSLNEADTYVFSIKNSNDKTIYKAITKSPFHSMTEDISKQFLTSNTKYHWAVSASNSNKNIISTSETYRFTVKKSRKNIHGQILLLLKNAHARSSINDLLNNYAAEIIESHLLRSIDRTLLVVQTSNNIDSLIESLQQEIIFEQNQPIYLYTTDTDANTTNFSTYKEPMDKFNKLVSLLHLEKQTYTGKNTIVAIIDSGIDKDHFDLRNNVIKTYNFLSSRSEKAETHGTAVAGIIAGQVNNKGSRGIAPNTRIIGYRACYQNDDANSSATCTSKSIALSLDQAILDKVNIINMSFGSEENDQLVSLLIDEGRKQNIIFTASSGNRKQQSSLSFPARHPAVISVAGITEAGESIINSKLLDQTQTIAPTENLFTTVPDNKYNFMNGSSMSTAIITGLLSLAHEKFGKLDIKQLPPKNLDICIWQSDLLQTPNNCN